MQSIFDFQQVFIEYLKQFSLLNKSPRNLYKPVQYILDLGGKRLRPVLTLMSCEAFNSSCTKALDAALAIEMFHNFTLLHDDIMDDAPLRRGKETVHEKWDVSTGILSGDAMLILSNILLENYSGDIYRNLMLLFNKTALQVCEGQQLDIDFETRDDVTIDEYLKMIEYKTAVLVGAAMKMGAIIANAPEEDQNLIYEFGKLLGIAFQLQDDYLDTFGNTESFGKQIGGDIVENKKTYLFIKSLELCSNSDKEQLLHLYSISPKHNEDKIEAVKQIFTASGSANAVKDRIQFYTSRAFEVLNELNISSEKEAELRQFGTWLMTRNV